MKVPLAAVVHTGHGIADPIFAAFVETVKAQGWRVHGLLQVSNLSAALAHGQNGQRRMELIDVALGQRYVISQNLGSGSVSCCLCADALVAVSNVLRRAVVEQPDLLVVNRFGKLEAQGAGLRHEMVLAVEAGVPLVTAVSDKYFSDWMAFTNGLAENLPPTLEALEAWWQRQLTERKAHGRQ